MFLAGHDRTSQDLASNPLPLNQTNVQKAEPLTGQSKTGEIKMRAPSRWSLFIDITEKR